MELTGQLLSSLSLLADSAPRTKELCTTLKKSFAMVHTMMDEYIQMTKDREEWWKVQLQHERERQTVWEDPEESLQTVVREGEALERELPTRLRKRGSRFFDVGANDGTGTLRQRPATLVSTSASVPGEHIPTPSYFAPSQRHAPITIVYTPEDVDGNGNGVSTAIVQSPATSQRHPVDTKIYHDTHKITNTSLTPTKKTNSSTRPKPTCSPTSSSVNS